MRGWVWRDDMRRWTWFDSAVLVLILVGAAYYQLARTNLAYPFVELKGDAGQIAGFAVAMDHPELFRGDEVLGSVENLRFYMTIHIPLLRRLAAWVGDYGTAYILWIGPHFVLQALGFYLLGRVVLRDRYGAALLALVTLVPVRLNLGTLWGAWGDPLARTTFQALLPFLLTVAFCWRDRPGRWPWLMVGAGLLMYVHPVSAPAWGFALWVALWFCQPSAWGWWRRLGVLFVNGVLFLAVCMPFVFNYLGHHEHGMTLEAGKVLEILTYRHAPGFMDPPGALLTYLGIVCGSGLLPLAVLGALALYVGFPFVRERARYVAGWALGLVVVGMVVPVTKQAITDALGMVPVETDLIRNIRYLVPLMLLACLWPVVAYWQRLSRGGAVVVMVVATVGVLGWGKVNRPQDFVLLAPENWLRGLVGEAYLARSERFQMLEAVRRHTPPGAAVFPSGGFDPQSLRYYALRPVAHCFKNGGPLAYANHAHLLRWYERDQALREIGGVADVRERVARLVDFAGRVGAAYAIVAREELEAGGVPEGAALVDQTQSYALVRVPAVGSGEQLTRGEGEAE